MTFFLAQLTITIWPKLKDLMEILCLLFCKRDVFSHGHVLGKHCAFCVGHVTSRFPVCHRKQNCFATVTIRIHCSYMVIYYNGEIYLCFPVSLHHDGLIHSPPWNISLIAIQVESAPYVYVLIRSVFSNISAQPFLFYCYRLH